MIDKENNPMEYFAGLYEICPYCRDSLNLVGGVTKESSEFSVYRHCVKCDKIFETTKSINLKRLHMSIEIRQLSNEQVQEFKLRFKERFDGRT